MLVLRLSPIDNDDCDHLQHVPCKPNQQRALGGARFRVVSRQLRASNRHGRSASSPSRKGVQQLDRVDKRQRESTPDGHETHIRRNASRTRSIRARPLTPNIRRASPKNSISRSQTRSRNRSASSSRSSESEM